MSSIQRVPGDFLSLLAEHQRTPFHSEGAVFNHQHSGHAPIVTESTTVFAFHFSEGVLMAGDRRATAGNIIVTDLVEKVIQIDSESLLAIAGVPATAFEMARILQTSFEYYRRSQLQKLSLPAKVRSLARLLKENLPMTMQGIGIVVPLFAGLDHEGAEAQPRIYFYDPLGAQFLAVGHAASGSGSGTIRSIMAYQERYGSPRPTEMSQIQAVEFAARLLVTAAEFDSATGGVNPQTNTFPTVKTLTRHGVRTISSEEQRQMLAKSNFAIS
jgi:proteasome beta subunit